MIYIAFYMDELENCASLNNSFSLKRIEYQIHDKKWWISYPLVASLFALHKHMTRQINQRIIYDGSDKPCQQILDIIARRAGCIK